MHESVAQYSTCLACHNSLLRSGAQHSFHFVALKLLAQVQISKGACCSPRAPAMSLGNLGLLSRLSNRLLRTKSAALGPP